MFSPDQPTFVVANIGQMMKYLYSIVLYCFYKVHRGILSRPYVVLGWTILKSYKNTKNGALISGPCLRL